MTSTVGKTVYDLFVFVKPNFTHSQIGPVLIYNKVTVVPMRKGAKM
jgi:hypothetical protein